MILLIIIFLFILFFLFWLCADAIYSQNAEEQKEKNKKERERILTYKPDKKEEEKYVSEERDDIIYRFNLRNKPLENVDEMARIRSKLRRKIEFYCRLVSIYDQDSGLQDALIYCDAGEYKSYFEQLYNLIKEYMSSDAFNYIEERYQENEMCIESKYGNMWYKNYFDSMKKTETLQDKHRMEETMAYRLVSGKAEIENV